MKEQSKLLKIWRLFYRYRNIGISELSIQLFRKVSKEEQTIKSARKTFPPFSWKKSECKPGNLFKTTSGHEVFYFRPSSPVRIMGSVNETKATYCPDCRFWQILNILRNLCFLRNFSPLASSLCYDYPFIYVSLYQAIENISSYVVSLY